MREKAWQISDKKRVLACLVLGMVCVFTGCRSGSEDTMGTEEGSYYSELIEMREDEDLMADENNLITVGFVQVGSESDWRITNTQSYREVFTEENGYYLIFADGQQKQENQVKAVRNFILQEVDYIVLDPIVETGWESVLQEAKEAGIPVILVDRRASVSDDSLYTCWVGSDFEEEGRRAGQWLEQYLADRNLGEKEINIVTLQGTIGSTAQIGRTEGFAQIAEENPNWNILEQQTGDFTQAKAQEVMEYFLQTYDDIDVVVSENDNMTFGVMEAVKEAGLELGSDGDMIILSFDAVKDALLAVQSGDIAADFECNPLLAPLVEEIIQQLENGENGEKIRYVEETYFDGAMDMETILEHREY